MNLLRGALPYFLVPFLVSLALVPVCKQIGFKLGIYAQENSRTVHHGKIVRMGGTAIFCAFILAVTMFMSADDTLNGIILGGTLVFIGGLLDDIYDLSPKKKIMFQLCGALIAMVLGKIYLSEMHIFRMNITNPIITCGISLFWIIGVTNAINLIDGLDGLSSGISTIVILTIGLLGYFMGRRDICILALCLSGAILGFLPYNFHPASIFVGDCGAQFMGFTIACISLLGFKTTALITLGFPILLLFIPISDTLLAIVRRKLKGQKFSQADKGHLHHVLMIKLKLGHQRTVLTLYLVTILFAASAVISYFYPGIGLTMVAVMVILFELFIEYTGMVNPRFHPILSLMNRTVGWPMIKDGQDPVDSAMSTDSTDQ